MSLCECCGRQIEDFSEPLTGSKGKRRKDDEDRTVPYRKWRFKFGDGCYVSDVDQVEWRKVGGVLVPVATLEITAVKGEEPLPDTYLDNTLKRYNDRDFQGTHSRHVASVLGVACYIVVFRMSLSQFWVYNLTKPRERINPRDRWWDMTKEKYERWLRSLGRPRA